MRVILAQHVDCCSLHNVIVKTHNHGSLRCSGEADELWMDSRLIEESPKTKSDKDRLIDKTEVLTEDHPRPPALLA